MGFLYVGVGIASDHGPKVHKYAGTMLRINPKTKEVKVFAEGLRNRVVCRNDDAQRLMPQPLLGAREAIRAALDRVAHEQVETSWSMAGPIPGDPDWAGPLRRCRVRWKTPRRSSRGAG